MPRFVDKTLQKGYDIGRKEVAREIFEEISEYLLSDAIDEDLIYDEYYGANVAIGRTLDKINKLKKKYESEVEN